MTESQHITLRELQRRVKSALEGQFALPLWVSAEISEIKVNYSGHCYLELVEKGGDNGRADSAGPSRRVAFELPPHRRLFRGRNGPAARRGHQNTGQGAGHLPRALRLLAPDTDIDPSYTLGDMERQRQQTIAQLQQEGVWDMNREAPMPGRRAARGHRVERQRRRLSGLLQWSWPEAPTVSN